MTALSRDLRDGGMVSLVIPYFNHASTLARAVISGIVQSSLREIIVVDDNSSQSSLDALQGVAAEHAIVRVLKTERNLGPGGARNLGGREAEGRYVCFLDADDELVGDFFAEAIALLMANPDMLVAKGDMEHFDPIKGYILPSFDPRYRAAVLSSSCGTVIDRQVFLRMGGFPENQIFRGKFGGEDVAFMQAVIKNLQPIGRVDRICYRVWSRCDSHVDRFLATTRLSEQGFEFVQGNRDLVPSDELADAVEAFVKNAVVRLQTGS